MNKNRTLVIPIGILFILFIGFASADLVKFDNVKSYDAVKQEVTITNFFGLGGEIAKVKLDTPIVNYVMRGDDRLVAEFTIENPNDYSNVFDAMEFYDLKQASQKIDRVFTYRYKALTGTKDVPIYNKEVCKEMEDKNGTKYQNCSRELLRYDKEDVYEWNSFNEKEVLTKGNITIGIFTDVYAGDYIEWIPTFYGVKITEWATWTDGFNVGLTNYYPMDNNSDVVGNSDLYANDGQITFSAGLIGNAGDFDASKSMFIKNSAPIDKSIWTWNTTTTLNFWIKESSFPAYPVYFARDAGGGSGKQELYTDTTHILTNSRFSGSMTSTPNKIPTGGWVMITLRRDEGTTTTMWINGTQVGSATSADNVGYLVNVSMGDGSTTGGSNLLGQMDEVGLWNRSLSNSEIADLYNAGAGITWKATGVDAYPIITLNSPANYTNFSVNSITFNCSAMDDYLIKNISLWINGQRNYTLNDGADNYTELYITRNLAEGEHNWSCSADDNATATKTGWTLNRTLTIDLTSPEVNILSPANNSLILVTSLPFNISMNISLSDTFGFTNCWWFNSTDNVSITCGENTSINLTAGSHILRFYANDSVGHITENSTEFYINYYNSTGAEYTTPIIEGNNNTIYFNFSATNLSSATANITYNGTTYIMSGSSNGTFARFSVNATAPSVSAPQNINFSITILINGATTFIFGNYSQFIYHIEGVTFASSCSDMAYNFTFRDEQNFTILNGTMEYNLKWGTTANNTKYSNYGKLEGIKSFYLCINSSIPSNWSVGEGEIFYRSDGYVDRRYYIFTGSTLTNNTINITLFDLLSAIQTSFKLEVESTSLSPYLDKYVGLIRWYPDLNQYNIVDMGKTDEKGESVVHVRTEDVDYRIGVYEKDGSLIKLANPIRMVCLVTPCTYTLQISPTETDFTNFLNIDYTFNYNSTSGIWTFVWTDTSQTTQSMNLTIWKLGGDEVFPVCSNVVTGTSGAITCNTSIYLASENTLEGRVERTASPAIPLAIKTIVTKVSAFASKFGLLISIFLGIPVIFIFAFVSPIGAILGGVIALIPALYFGAINWAILGGIAVLGGIVIHFLKRIS